MKNTNEYKVYPLQENWGSKTTVYDFFMSLLATLQPPYLYVGLKSQCGDNIVTKLWMWSFMVTCHNWFITFICFIFQWNMGILWHTKAHIWLLFPSIWTLYTWRGGLSIREEEIMMIRRGNLTCTDAHKQTNSECSSLVTFLGNTDWVSIGLNLIRHSICFLFNFLSQCSRCKNHNYCFSSYLLLKDIQFSLPSLACPPFAGRFQTLPQMTGLLLTPVICAIVHFPHVRGLC